MDFAKVRKVPSGFLLVLIQISSCAPQMCDSGSILDQKQLNLNAVIVSVNCYETGNVGVNWSASGDQVNTLTLQYACSNPSIPVSGVLLDSSNEYSGQIFLPDGPYQEGITCSVWGCFEWNNPLRMYPDVAVGNTSCTTLSPNQQNIWSTISPSCSEVSLLTQSDVAVMPSNFASSAVISSNNMAEGLVLILAVVLISIFVALGLTTAVIALLRHMREMHTPSLSFGSISSIKVDATVAGDIESVTSDNASFSPLDYSTPTSPTPPRTVGQNPVMLYFDPQPVCPHTGVECCERDLSSCGYLMITSFQINGSANENSNTNQSYA